MKGLDTEIGGKGKFFPETMWSQILHAGDQESPEYRKNVDYLVSVYWKPVYRYIRVSWGKSNEDAKDLTQEFFTFLLQKEQLASVSPHKGRFRTYIKTVLKHFLINEREARNTIKRGGKAVKIRFDDIKGDGPEETRIEDPAEYFDRQWFMTLLEKCVKVMKEFLIEKNKGIYFKVFEAYNIRNNPEKPTYSHIAGELGIKETDVTNYLRYTRRLLRSIMKEEVSKYVEDASLVEEELKYLLSIKV